jgi:hypothetical protein
MRFEEVESGRSELKHTRIKSVKADLLSGTVTVSFVFTLDEEMLKVRKHLRALAADDDTTLDLIIVEKSLQLALPLAVDEHTTTTLTAAGPDGESVTVDFDKTYAAVMGRDRPVSNA